MGVTRQDRLTNEAIRKTLNVNSLNHTNSKYRDNWFLTTSDQWNTVVFHDTFCHTNVPEREV
jgi:hypothetical protein